MTTFKCKNCDFVSCDNDAKYCPQCGQILEVVKEEDAGSGACAPCPNCGSTRNAADAKFCLDCGTSLARPAASKPAILVCVACGFNKNAADARFCHQCGASLGKGAKPAAAVPTQTSVSPIKRSVNGPKLKEMPIARLFDKTSGDEGVGGKIMLLTDGILFVSSHLGQVSIPASDIASATGGEKANLLEIRLKNGDLKIFRFAGAKNWAPAIKSILLK